MAKKRIPLGPNFHAEPGETKGHQHDVYTTAGELHGLQRLHMGTLMKRAVEGLATALAEAEARGRRQGLEWQPIETAPRDGTIILVVRQSERGRRYIEASAWRRDSFGKFYWGRHGEFMPSWDKAVSWSPMPALPSLATAPAETQKPETGESLNRLLASAEPTVSRQGNLLMLDCPDGTITDEIFNVLEAACYSSPNRSSLAALKGGEQP